MSDHDKKSSNNQTEKLKAGNNSRKQANLENVPDHPYPELPNVLDLFVNSIQAELADNLIGIYLVGSIATGDFDLDSDVDFLVVTKRNLSVSNAERLQEIQEAIHAIGVYPAQHLEGSFFPIYDLNNWQTVGKKNLYYFDNGSTKIEQTIHDNNWHVRWVLRERGITLVGNDPKIFMEPIPQNSLFNEMKTLGKQFIAPFEEAIHQPLNFMNSQFGQSFFVLTYCRILHTLQTGTVQSKKAGAEWAKTFVDERWQKLIDQAWRDREGVRFCIKIKLKADQAQLEQTLLFLKYAAGLAEDFSKVTVNDHTD